MLASQSPKGRNLAAEQAFEKATGETIDDYSNRVTNEYIQRVFGDKIKEAREKRKLATGPAQG